MLEVRLKSLIKRWRQNYQCKAKKRGIEWTLSDEEFEKICSQNCAYCGAEPIQRQWKMGNKNRGSGYHIRLSTERLNGIDRIDNSKGYTVENATACCGICNSMKLALTVDQFLTHLLLIIRHMGLK